MFSSKFKQGFFIVGLSVCAATSAFSAIENTVTVKGTAPGGAVDGIEANDTESVTVIAANPDLKITKTHDIITGNSDGYADAGEKVRYTFKVENIGNTTLTNVTINDTFDPDADGDVVPDNEVIFLDVAPLNDSTDVAINKSWDSLAPGDIIHFTAEYLVTQTDVDTFQN